MKWLKALNPEALYKEILEEYLLTYTILSDKLERLDQRIEGVFVIRRSLETRMLL